MKQAEVKCGRIYAVKVSGKICPVKVDRIKQTYVLGAMGRGPSKARYEGTNLVTDRSVVFTAAKCRFEYAAGLCQHRLSKWAMCSLAPVPGTDRCAEHTA